MDIRNLPNRMELPQSDELPRLGNRNEEDPDGAYDDMIEQEWADQD